MQIIDRRLNPSGKSGPNRVRFKTRAQSGLRKAVSENLREKGSVRDTADRHVKVPIDGLNEPTIRRDTTTGVHRRVLSGNKRFDQGDEIPRPKRGNGGGGSEGSPDGDGLDEFEFALTVEEYMDILFEGCELPDLVKVRAGETDSYLFERAGYSRTGSPNNLDLVQTMRQSIGRRIALKRPTDEDIAALREEISQLEIANADPELIWNKYKDLEQLFSRKAIVPFIEPSHDVRYRSRTRVPKPVTQAVMLCLMDVSGSMTEEFKELAKRFYLLLYVFLTKRYKYVDVVFVRHTHVAKEVDEETFFNDQETGGTIVSSVLELAHKIMRERYAHDWNIYVAQASDGDNMPKDDQLVLKHMSDILPLVQYFAYVQVKDDKRTDLWRTYEAIAELHFVMRIISEVSDVVDVFRELFRSKSQAA